MRTNQSTIISKKIEELMERGMTNKSEIYSKTVEELNVPAPTVRRVAKDLRDKLKRHSEILQV